MIIDLSTSFRELVETEFDFAGKCHLFHSNLSQGITSLHSTIARCGATKQASCGTKANIAFNKGITVCPTCNQKFCEDCVYGCIICEDKL